jgi:hypothetical protein
LVVRQVQQLICIEITIVIFIFVLFFIIFSLLLFFFFLFFLLQPLVHGGNGLCSRLLVIRTYRGKLAARLETRRIP